MPREELESGREVSFRGPLETLDIWVLNACEDSPRACTGRRILRLGLGRDFRSFRGAPFGGVILDPLSPRPLCPALGPRARDKGLLVIDCSWNQIRSRGRLPPELGRFPLRHALRVRLPLLIAGNPQHFGRWTELNTAEAVGAALYLLRGPSEAERFLRRFSFGWSFLQANGERLRRYYQEAITEDDVLTLERQEFQRPEADPVEGSATG
jgi:pre-rRNA-processing protein TSR3